MARRVLDNWIPVEKGSAVIGAVQANSAVEALARPEPMATDTKEVPRAGSVDVAVTPKGSAYTESTGSDDMVTLRARKFTGLLRIADEDLDDSPANVIAQKQLDWANGYAVAFDNACLGTIGVEDQTLGRPFTSIYQALAAGLAGNITTSATATALTEANVQAPFAAVEGGAYAGNLVVFAHPYFKGAMRGLKDAGGNPVFVQVGGGSAALQDSIYGYPVFWTRGAKTSTALSTAPTGDPLLIVVNRDYLIKGVRSGPEFAAISGWNGASALTDEALIKARARRGFALGQLSAAAILRDTP
jgi:HK97 family phage major capsid protein